MNRCGAVLSESDAVLLAQGVFTRKVSVLPRPVHATTFSDAIQGIDNGTSAAMYHALQGAHLLDLKDMLVQDPRFVEIKSRPPFILYQ